MREFRYVQPDIPMELNRNIQKISGAIQEAWKTENGMAIRYESGYVAKGFEAASADDLAVFNQSNASSGVAVAEGSFVLQFSFLGKHVLQVEVNPEDCGCDYGLLKKLEEVSPKFEENEEYYLLTNGIYTVRVHKEQGTYEVLDSRNVVRLEESRSCKSIYWGYFAPPLSHIQCREETYTAQSFHRFADESFYGFGEQFTDLDKRNQLVDIWNVDPANTLSSPSYKNIPFFMSTRNYGIVMNSSRRSQFDMGTQTSEAISIRLQGKGMRYAVILGDSMKEVLDRYYLLTGEPSMTPMWSFGIWMSSLNRYYSAENLAQVAKEFRDRDFPCDVLHVDPVWMDAKTLVCPFGWGEKFGDHAKMVKELKEQGFKLSLWVAPYLPLTSPLYEYGLEHDYYVKDHDGKVIVNKGTMNFWSEPFVYFDFTNPEAAGWYKSLIRTVLREGADIIKNDLGELGPMEALYYNGMDGAEGHNFYTLEYARATYEACQEEKGEDAIIWCRSGFIGVQKYPCHWAGDVTCNFENMKGQLRAVLSAGTSGFIFFSHDTAGFVGEPTPELYARWFQMGMFTSHMRAHGCAAHEPWQYGSRVEEICRRYAKLRYRLLPTLYTAAGECCRTHQPMAKALVLDYQDDLTARTVSDEYIFADRFLVCPVFDGDCTRRLYLPEGVWFEYETGKAFEGGRWYDFDCSLEYMPLFVRDGSVVFTCEDQPYIDSSREYPNLKATVFSSCKDTEIYTVLADCHGKHEICISIENGAVVLKNGPDMNVELVTR